MDFEGIFFEISDFELTDKFLGSGSFGKVYVVKNLKNKENYAAKIISVDGKAGFTGKDQNLLMRESIILHNLSHPAIVKFYGINFQSFNKLSNLEPTIITEYLPKGSLKEILDKEKISIADHEWTATKKYICLLGISHAMKYLHDNGIIHRDLKPENILIDINYLPKICDFGLSRCLPLSLSNSFKLTMTGQVGTPLYMAPEILMEDGSHYGPEVDVYAFAILAYEIVTGKAPYHELGSKITPFGLANKIFSGYRPTFSNNNTTSKMEELISKCWSGNPDERPSFDMIYSCILNDRSILGEDIDDDEVDDYVENLEKVSSNKINIKTEATKIDEKEVKELEAEKNKYEKEVKELKDEKNKYKKEIKELNDEKNKYKKDIKELNDEKNKYEAQCKQLTNKIDQDKVQMDKLKDDYQKIKKELEQKAHTEDNDTFFKLKPPRYLALFMANIFDEIGENQEAVNAMKIVIQLNPNLNEDERNMLNISYKNLVKPKREANRTLNSYIDDVKGRGNKERLEKLLQAKEKIYIEVKKLSLELISIINNALLPAAKDAISRVFYLKLKADYYKYISEIKPEKDTIEKAKICYERAMEISKNELHPASPTALGTQLNYSVYLYEIANKKKEAIEFAKRVFKTASDHVDTLSDDLYSEAILILQLIKENITFWEEEQK